MKNYRGFSLVGMGVVLAFATGCAAPITPVVPYYGFGFNSTAAPVDIAFNETEIGQRTGKASAVCILGLFSFGDCSVTAAARDANISVVDQVDCQMTNILGIYAEYETMVSGRE